MILLPLPVIWCVLQERPLNLDEDGEDINTFEREEDAWSEEDFYEEEL